MSKQFSDTSTKLGLIQDCEMKLFGDSGYGQISGNTNRLYQFTARINSGQDRFAYLAMTADGRWQWDDTNNTDYPEATTNIVSGQRDYQFALEHMEIEKVLIKDSSGVWKLLDKTIDTSDKYDKDARAYLENNTGNSGTPSSYDKRGNTIFLQAIPNYNSTNGLKVIFKRGPNYFVYTDTIKVPGFASIFHDYLSLWASADYASDRTMTEASDLLGKVALREQAILDFYSLRNKDERPRLLPSKECNR